MCRNTTVERGELDREGWKVRWMAGWGGESKDGVRQGGVERWAEDSRLGRI